ncbi:MAG: putative LPS assembly protein LptD [Bacteroidales bacterium]|nr:putative LPS assembly protein LptD [Bacteroidales bacterium]
MYKNNTFIRIIVITISCCVYNFLYSQQKDSIKVSTDTLKKNSSSFNLEAPVIYSCSDSIVLDLVSQKAFLYNQSTLKYQDKDLKAYYIEIDLNNNEAYATGKKDSLGNLTEKPEFADGADEFQAASIRYNFNTKRGIITEVTTEQSGGYLHASRTKKLENDHICLTQGRYTTCNLEHPHFYITLTKAKVIPDDKIVSGPAYLVVEDIPVPLGIPFGFFPNKKKGKSGIIIPEYGEEEVRGFFLKNGGYYFAINDYMDLSILGEAYTKGSWGITGISNYKKRYKYQGNLNISYSNIIISERGLPNYQNNKAYYIRWYHNQDAKAHPFRNFSANVNVGSQIYNRFNMVSYENRLRSDMQSSISFRQQWPNSPFNLSANIRHNQNFTDSTITIGLPDIYFSMSRQTIFKKIGISYNSNLQNSITSKENKLFTSQTIHQMRNGVRHSIPVMANFKVFRYFNLNPSITYTERWYPNQLRKTWIPTQIINNDTIPGYLQTDTIYKFTRASDWSFSMPFTTQIYGFYMPKNTNWRFQGLRHMITPSISFAYRPDYLKTKYYKSVQINESGKTQSYSIVQNGIFGSPPIGKYGTINFSINNNLEMKYKSKSDTIQTIKKIPLLEQFSMSTAYNIALDSLRWQPVLFQARTTLFKVLNLYASANYNIYTYDTLGRFINQLQYNTNKKFANLTSASLSSSISLNSDGFVKNPATQTTEAARQAAVAAGLPDNYMQYYVDFKVPWTIYISYNLSSTSYFNQQKKQFEYKTIQGLTFSGDISLTPKWKISYSSGYDFENKKFTYTSLNIYRDLHCWEMRLSWIPFGTYRSYSFQINVKSSVLQDLKLARKRPFIDNF